MRACPPRYRPPGVIMAQSAKPRPVSPSKITTGCLHDELANDNSQLKLMARRCQAWMEITDDFFF